MAINFKMNYTRITQLMISDKNFITYNFLSDVIPANSEFFKDVILFKVRFLSNEFEKKK